MKPIEQKEKLFELRAKGYSLQAIANELGIAKQTAINWVKELEVEIQNAKALELDALYEKHLMSKQARIELFSEQLAKVRGELSKRQLDEVSTEKLFDMQLKLLATMKQEKETLALIGGSDGFEISRILASNQSYSIEN